MKSVKMSTAVNRKGKNFPAKIAVKKGPCAFCCREVDEETVYGKLYEIGDIYCHYFCVLLSCCLIQKGKDEDGLFGFLYPDILAEIARSKKHKCSYCGCEGANLGCSVVQCKKQFHLPCGRERKAVSMFYGNYKSFCQKHAPKQKISDTVMAKVKIRMAKKRNQNLSKGSSNTIKQLKDDDAEELACVICYEAVEGYPTLNTFWPPCCGRDAWFHRSCLERMALSAGVHYLKCPLCNDKEKFYEAVLQQGFYVPDRDAAWELEQNAFSEIYERSFSCGVDTCLCPSGRSHDADSGPWDINVCVLCGSAGAHALCRAGAESQRVAELPADGNDFQPAEVPKPYVCAPCAPAAASAPHLVQALHELAVQEQHQAAENERVVRPVMPSRMSLRRTKRRQDMPTSSTNKDIKTEIKEEVTNTEKSRMELNLKTPKRNILEPSIYRKVENKLLSPIKLLEQGLYERVSKMDMETIQLNSEAVIEKMRQKLKRPQPLIIKKKIVNNILEELMTTMYKDKFKTKDPLREWNSPKKCTELKTENTEILSIKFTKRDDYKINVSMETETYENNETKEVSFDSPKLKTIQIKTDSSMEISEGNNIVNIDLVTIEGSKNNTIKSPDASNTCSLKFSPIDKEKLNKANIIDLESFKTQYLNEVRFNFSDNSKTNIKDNEQIQNVNEDAKMVNQTDPRDKKEEWKRKRHKKNKVRKIKIQLNIKNKKKEKKNAKMKKQMKNTPKVLKQYVLEYDIKNKSNNITRPQKDVKTLKRKYVRKEKVSDNFKQTSLDNFFLLQFK